METQLEDTDLAPIVYSVLNPFFMDALQEVTGSSSMRSATVDEVKDAEGHVRHVSFERFSRRSNAPTLYEYGSGRVFRGFRCQVLPEALLSRSRTWSCETPTVSARFLIRIANNG